MYRTLLLWLLCTFSAHVLAMDIGSMTASMDPKEDFLVRTLANMSLSPKVYEVELEKINDPTDHGATIPTVQGELLFAPRRFTLHARRTQNVKFYYNGPADAQERYYRITFTESPVAQVDDGSQTQHRGTVEVKLALQSILVVRPRQVRFEYQLDPAKGSITNTGNTYFEFMIKKGCEQPDHEAESKYLLPGESYQNSKIGKTGNQHMIIYQQRFVPLGKEC
ncbi:TPA: fimbria/pilus periplasmic chaperone [Aeromonas veronii]|nr:fimbria/pilus periplasmic chaperone [Aeromonas veronii]